MSDLWYQVTEGNADEAFQVLKLSQLKVTEKADEISLKVMCYSHTIQWHAGYNSDSGAQLKILDPEQKHSL